MASAPTIATPSVPDRMPPKESGPATVNLKALLAELEFPGPLFGQHGRGGFRNAAVASSKDPVGATGGHSFGGAAGTRIAGYWGIIVG